MLTNFEFRTYVFIFVLFVFCFLIRNWLKNRNFVVDPKTGTKVYDAKDKEKSAYLIDTVKSRLRTLVIYCQDQYPKDSRVQRMANRFDPSVIQETSLYENATSYTVNKGSSMHLCLREKKTLRHHDINIIMFVAIHELAHIMSSGWGHGQEFQRNFKFLLQQASACNVYTPVNYASNNTNFCGLTVKHNPMYD